MGGGGSKPAAFSVEVAPASGDSGAIRRNPKYKDALVATAFPDVTTLYEGFQRGLKLNGDGNCMGYRTMTTKEVEGKQVTEAGAFQWMTYKQCQEKIDAIGSGLLHLNMVATNDTGHRLVGLFSKNRWEWVIAEQACHAYSMVDVPLYDTLGADAIAFIVGQTGMNVIFTDKSGVGKLSKIKKERGAEVPSFAHIVCFEEVSEAEKEACKEAGLTLRSFNEVAEAGQFNKAPHVPPKPEDLAFICYTSGTTGMPKGAMILHKNMVADACAAETAELGLTKADVHLSYLPLAHVFERLVQAAFYMAGGSIGFYQGDTLRILEDVKALRPSIFPSVPRLYNRIHDKVMATAKAAGGAKTAIFMRAYEGKKYWLHSKGDVKHGLWDKLVFSKIAASTGLDRCRVFLTGSAPIAPHVIEFLRIVFSTAVCEGYGQTECSAAATLTSIHDQGTLGHVGGPLANNEVKLVSVTEMGYSVTDTVHGRELAENGVTVLNAGITCTGRGEVCYRGPNVFSGYYKDPEKTKEALDEEGWLHSGDIGLWDAAGNLRIIDRKKNIFKLSQGEYVAAEKIENVYIKAPLVMQVFVYGDSFHAVLVGVVVPDPDQIKAWAKANGKEEKSAAEICSDADFKKAVKAEMDAAAAEARLTSFEKVKDIHLEATAWTPEDILTPTFKLKRADAKKKYNTQIDAMYAALGDLVAGKSGLKQGAGEH